MEMHWPPPPTYTLLPRAAFRLPLGGGQLWSVIPVGGRHGRHARRVVRRCRRGVDALVPPRAAAARQRGAALGARARQGGAGRQPGALLRGVRARRRLLPAEALLCAPRGLPRREPAGTAATWSPHSPQGGVTAALGSRRRGRLRMRARSGAPRRTWLSSAPDGAEGVALSEGGALGGDVAV